MGITQMYEYPGALALRDFDQAYVRCGVIRDQGGSDTAELVLAPRSRVASDGSVM
jgi:hypothetical protein